jgi:hypothetical protein
MSTTQWTELELLQELKNFTYPTGGAGAVPTVLSWLHSSPTTDRTKACHGFRNLNCGLITSGVINLLPTNNKTLRALPGLEILNTFTRDTTVIYPRGIFYSRLINYLLEAWDNRLFINGTSTVAFTNGYTSGPVGFVEGVDSSGAVYVFVSSDSNSMTVSSAGAVTAIGDPDLPNPAIPTPVYLDSYIFLAKENSRSIYNSGAGAPSSWQASTFINTEESGGPIVALAKHKKYVVALCTDHIEFFEDAAIPSPNSPLRRKSELLTYVGCVNRASVCYHGDDVYFIGRDSTQGYPGVFRIRDTKVERISNHSISRALSSQAGSGYKEGVLVAGDWGFVTNTAAPSTNYTTMYITEINDRPLIILCIKSGIAYDAGAGAFAFGFPSFIYDIDLNFWVGLVLPGRNNSNYVAAGFPFPFGTIYKTSTGTFPVLISPIQNSNNLYYYWSYTGDMYGWTTTAGSYGYWSLTGNDASGYMSGVLFPYSDQGIPGRKFYKGLSLEVERINLISEPSSFPKTFSIITNILGMVSASETGDEYISVSLYPSGEWTTSAKEARHFSMGSSDQAFIFLRFLYSNININKIKLLIQAGTR